MIELRRCLDADELLRLAGDHLTTREAEHNLIFGILGRLRAQKTADGEPFLAALVDGERVTGVAVRTPPYGPVLSELEDASSADVVADQLAQETDTLAGVLGPPAAAERFARRWSALSGASAEVSMKQRIYRAESARAPTCVPGASRPFAPGDRELVLGWLRAFVDEAAPSGGPPFDRHAWLERQRTDDDGEILLWECTGEAVSLAACGQATPNGLRVGPVYTPPEHRSRGFGTAVTAAVTALALASGRRFCFLFTDLANPTSNAIYSRIGYQPVCDVDQWAFRH